MDSKIDGLRNEMKSNFKKILDAIQNQWKKQNLEIILVKN
jgi:hypothetical protein